MCRTRRTSTHALIARFKLSALLAHLTTKTLPTLIVVGLEVPVLTPAERPLPFVTSLWSIVCFSRIARGTHHQREHQKMPTRACSGVRDVGTCSAGGGHLGLVVGGRSGVSARFP